MHTRAHSNDTIFNSSRTQKVTRAASKIPSYWQWRLYVIFMLLNDLVMIGLAFRLSYFIRFELGIPVFQELALQSVSFYRTLVFILIPIWLTVFAIVGLYNRQNLLGGTREYSLVFNGTTIGMFLVIAAGFLAHDYVFARGWLLMAWGIAFTLISLGRFILRRVIYYLRGEGYYLSPAVIVGANDEGISLAQQLSKWKTSGFHVIGFVDKKLPAGYPVLKNLQCLGTVDQLDSILANYGVEEIILASSAISSRDKMLDIFKRYGVTSDVNVRMSSGLYEIMTTGLRVREFSFVPLVCVNKVRLTGFDNLLKVILDYGISIPLVILISPILLLIAIAVRLDSPGPVIYRRRVMGVNNRQFDAFKFRTMRIDGDQILAQSAELQQELMTKYKLKSDPRITRLGSFLRKLSLDELPQIFNVLRYEMSLVGPRMIHPDEMKEYNQWGMNLLTVRPGITGLWQVSGRSDLSYAERVRLDMQYIRNWSIWLDLQLLVQTIPAALKSKGAY